MLASAIPESMRVLIDGGTFRHMFGTGVVQLLVNRRKVTPVPISTAGGVAWVDEMADLYIGEYGFKDGYVNPHMTTTLISEGVQNKQGWKFLTTEDKWCLTPHGNFIAERHDTLHFWPVVHTSDGAVLNTEPHHTQPVTREQVNQLMSDISEAELSGGSMNQSLIGSGDDEPSSVSLLSESSDSGSEDEQGWEAAEQELQRLVSCATHWLSDYMAGGVKEQAIQEHLDQGHTSPLVPHLSDEKWEACAKAFAQDKPAYQVSKTAKS